MLTKGYNTNHFIIKYRKAALRSAKGEVCPFLTPGDPMAL